ncbi:MAG: hypothetical protein FJX65_11875 [Alphaproteobacteria bacterium]|nr:hypothetical protein [Alphaproteobacteria bacterium]
MTAAPAQRSTPVAYRPRRLGHINLFVLDTYVMKEFLTQVCGFEMTGIISKTRSAFFSNGNTHHDIGFIETASYKEFRRKYPDPNDPPGRGDKPALNHFGWEMEHEADLAAAYERAKSAGLKPRITNNGTSLSNYLFDPDGGQHQFYADDTLDWRTVYTGADVDLHRPATWVPGAQPPSTARNYDPNPTIRRSTTSILHPMRVTHAVLLCAHHEAMVRFYTEIAGFDVVHRGADYVYLGGSASHYDIVLMAAGARAPGLHHAAFEVWPDEDLATAAKALRARNIEVVAEHDLAHKRSLTLRDPNGILFEFYVRRTGGFADVARATGDARALAA